MSGAELSAEAAGFLQAQRAAVLATVFSDGRPHAAPISPVIHEGHILIATESNTVKVANIRANPSICLSADAYDEDWDRLRSVVVFGTAVIHSDGATWETGRALQYAKYPQYETEAPITLGSTVMLEIVPERVIETGLDQR